MKLEEITPVESGVSARTGASWQKNEIVVITTGEWPKRFRLTCFGDLCTKAAAIAPGTLVKIRFSIEQREVPANANRKAFWVNDVTCHNITPYVAQNLQPQYAPTPTAPPQYPQAPPSQYQAQPVYPQTPGFNNQ